MGGGKVVSWVLYGALAFLLALVNLALALLGKGRGQNGLLFGSLACGVLNMLEEYRMAVEWVQKEDLVSPYGRAACHGNGPDGCGLPRTGPQSDRSGPPQGVEKRKNQLTTP